MNMKHKIISAFLWILVIASVILIPVGFVCTVCCIAADLPKMSVGAWVLIGEFVLFLVWYIGKKSS